MIYTKTKILLGISILMCIFMLSMAAGAITLPTPPSVGGGSTTDVWDYLVTAVKTIAGVILVALFVWFVFSGGGGLMGSLAQAKESGKWGNFFIYLGSMLLVGVILLFLVYYANEEFLQLI